MQCPKCQSDNVQRAEVIHSQGTTQINTTSSTVGVASGSGGIAFGSAQTKTSGTAQSNLARQLAPPHNLGLYTGGIMAALAALLAKLAFADTPSHPAFGTFLMAVCVASFAYAILWPINVRKPLVARWLKLWYCNKCGTKFVERDAQPVPKAMVTKSLGLVVTVLFCGSVWYMFSTLSTEASEEKPSTHRAAAESSPSRQYSHFLANAVLTQDVNADIDPTHKLQLPAGTEIQYIGPAQAGLYPAPHSLFRFKQSDCDTHHFNCKRPLALPDNIWQKKNAVN